MLYPAELQGRIRYCFDIIRKFSQVRMAWVAQYDATQYNTATNDSNELQMVTATPRNTGATWPVVCSQGRARLTMLLV